MDKDLLKIFQEETGLKTYDEYGDFGGEGFQYPSDVPEGFEIIRNSEGDVAPRVVKEVGDYEITIWFNGDRREDSNYSYFNWDDLPNTEFVVTSLKIGLEEPESVSLTDDWTDAKRKAELMVQAELDMIEDDEPAEPIEMGDFE